MQEYYFVIGGKTVFLPFRSLYPECYFLIKDEPKLSPLKCMQDTCHRNANCGARLANIVHYFFTEVEPDAKLLVAYFSYQDKPGSVRAGLFSREMSEPRVITCNRAAFRKFQQEGVVKTWIKPLL